MHLSLDMNQTPLTPLETYRSFEGERRAQKKPSPSVIVPVAPGDLMRLADSLKLALELAEVAADIAARAGGMTGLPNPAIATIRRQIARLRSNP
jgi:hypothetical protein